MYDLIIIGAGIWGSSAALTAMRAGAKSVLLLEMGIGPAQESSAKGGGILTDLLWHPQDRQFVRRSRALYREAAETSQDTSLWRQTGMLTLTTGKDADLLRARAEEIAAADGVANVLGHQDVVQRFPALDRLPADTIALWTPSDWRVQPTAYALTAVSEARRLGLRLRTGARVSELLADDRCVDVRLEDGESLQAERVLVAAGTWTGKVLGTAGIDIALRPYRTQLASLELGSPHSLPIVWHLGTGMYLIPDGPSDILTGDGPESGESDPNDFRREGDEAFALRVTQRLGTVAGLGDGAALRSSWAGLCGATPDRRPLVGRVAPRLFCACGDQGTGVMRGPALGELAAEIALDRGQAPELDPLRFTPSEFPIRNGFTLRE